MKLILFLLAVAAVSRSIHLARGDFSAGFGNDEDSQRNGGLQDQFGAAGRSFGGRAGFSGEGSRGVNNQGLNGFDDEQGGNDWGSGRQGGNLRKTGGRQRGGYGQPSGEEWGNSENPASNFGNQGGNFRKTGGRQRNWGSDQQTGGQWNNPAGGNNNFGGQKWGGNSEGQGDSWRGQGFQNNANGGWNAAQPNANANTAGNLTPGGNTAGNTTAPPTAGLLAKIKNWFTGESTSQGLLSKIFS